MRATFVPLSLALLAAVFASCGDGERSVTGVIVEVEAPTLTEIESFTFRDNDGRMLTFEVAPEAERDIEEGFVGGHLRTHALAADQVTVHYREEDGRRLALRLEHD